jgi:hypothetical protein
VLDIPSTIMGLAIIPARREHLCLMGLAYTALLVKHGMEIRVLVFAREVRFGTHR